MPETHRVPRKRVNERKSIKLEQCIQQFADFHTEHRGRQLDFDFLSQQAQRLRE